MEQSTRIYLFILYHIITHLLMIWLLDSWRNRAPESGGPEGDRVRLQRGDQLEATRLHGGCGQLHLCFAVASFDKEIKVEG